MNLSSVSFQNNAVMQPKYANTGVSGGKNISPQFGWSGFPSGARSFILTIIDIHPIASFWVHWMMINIPATVTSLDENISNSSSVPKGAKELVNSFGKSGYGGPQPPAGSGKHQYVATIYAMNAEKIDLSGHLSEKELLKNISQAIMDKASLTGIFSR